MINVVHGLPDKIYAVKSDFFNVRILFLFEK